MLPQQSRLKKRWELEDKKKCWDKWNLLLKSARKLDWACKLMKNSKEGFLHKNKLGILGKYFRKFALFRPKSLHYPDVTKGLNKIHLLLIKRDWPEIKEKLLEFGNNKAQSKAISLFFGQSKSYLKHKLKRALLKWYRIMLKDDSNIKSHVLRNFKKIVIENYFSSPLEKGLRKWLRKMITKPFDPKRLIVGEEKIREVLRRHIGHFAFPKIKDHRSPEYFSNLIMSKVLPSSKFASKRIQRLRLLKWKEQANKLMIREIRVKSFSILYTGNQNKIFSFFLGKYFRKWRKRPLNLAKVIQGEKLYFGTLVRKYLVGFIPDMKNFFTYKFLRGILLGSSKYQIRKLRPFFSRWADISRKLKAQELKLRFWGRLVSTMKTESAKKEYDRIMRNKFNQWKTQSKALTEKIKANADEGSSKIKNDVKKKSFPLFLKNLKDIADKNKKINRLGEADRIIKNFWRIWMKKRLLLWEKKARILAFKQLQSKFIQKHLRLWQRKLNNNNMKRCFEKMKKPKEVIVLQKNYNTIAIGIMTYKRIFTRKPFDHFKKVTGMMNLNVPFGMNLSQILLKKGINVGKCFFIRTMSMRPYWKKYKNQIEQLKDRDLQEKMTKKMLFRFGDKNKRLITRMYYNLWKENVNKMILDEAIQDTRKRVTKLIYGKNQKILLRRKFNFWKKVNEKYLKMLDNTYAGGLKLRTKLLSKYMTILLNNFRNTKENQLKKDKSKEVIKRLLLNFDFGKKIYFFSAWKKKVYEIKMMLLKLKIFKNLVNKYEWDENKKQFYRLKECYLFWRLQAFPKNLYDFITKIRKGEEKIMKTMRKPFNKDVFDAIKRKAIYDKIKKRLIKLFFKHNENSKIELLKIMFLHWRLKAGNKSDNKNKIRLLFLNYLQSQKGQIAAMLKPLKQLKGAAQRFKSNKDNSVLIMQKFFRNMGKDLKLRAGTKDVKLRSSFRKQDNKKSKGLVVYFALWKKMVSMIDLSDAGKLIQKFLRTSMIKREEKENKAFKLTEILKKVVRKIAFRRIKHRAKINRWAKLMLKNCKDIPPEMKKAFLRQYYYRWLLHFRKFKENKSSFLITSLARGYKTRTFVKKILKQKFKLNEIICRLFRKHLNQLKLYYNKWNILARFIKASQAANVISAFLNKKKDFYQERETKKKMRFWFRNLVRKQIAEVIKKSGKLNKNSASVLYNTLRNIYWVRPFDLLKITLRKISQIKKLKYVYPVLMEKFRTYWLPHYYNKWKNKVRDEKLKKILILQNMIRGRIALWKEKTRLKKFLLLTKYLAKMTRDNRLLKLIHLHIWKHKAKNMFMNKAILNVQKMFQGNNSRKGLDREVNKLNLKGLFRRLFLRDLKNKCVNLADFLEPLKAFLSQQIGQLEDRIGINGLLEIGKDNIRNNILAKMTGKKAYNDYKTSLRRYMDLWKHKTQGLDKHAQRLQNNFRALKARKLLKLKLKIKKNLLKVLEKNEKTKQGKLKVWFNLWRTILNLIDVEKGIKNIQNYMRKKNNKWQLKKLQNKFWDLAYKRTSNLMNKASKFNKLKAKLQKIMLDKFIKHMKKREKNKKLTWFFLKRFSAEDERFKNLFLSKYLNDWRDIMKKLNNLRNQSALKIQKNYKAYLWRKWLLLQRKKKENIYLILDKLTNDNDLRKRIRFCLWKNKVKSNQLADSARMISSLFMDSKNKLRRKKNKERLDEIKNGIEPLFQAYKKASTKEPFNQIKVAAKMKFLNKLTDKLSTKQKDNEQQGFNKIKEFAEFMKNLKNALSSKLQKRWKLFWYRKGIWKIISKIRKMRLILKLMLDRDLRFKNKALKLWRYNAMGDIWLKSAENIRNFCLKRVLRFSRDKREESINRFRKLFIDGFLKLNLIKYAKEFRYSKVLSPAIHLLKQYIFKKLKYNIDNYQKLNYMWKLFRVPKSCLIKMLRKKFLLWRENATHLKRDLASKKITRNLRSHNKRKKENKVKKLLESKLKELALKHSDMKKYYFLKWLAIEKQLKILESAKTIGDFVNDNWGRIRAKKLYKMFSAKLFNLAYFKDGLGLMNRWKKFKFLDKLVIILDKRCKKINFDELKNNMRQKILMKFSKLLFSNFENRENLLLLKAYFRRWKGIKNNIEKRESAIKGLMNLFDNVAKINAAKNIGDACLVKKLNKLINLVKSKKAMKKLKNHMKYLKTVNNLKEQLKKHDTDLAVSNPNITVNIYKFFVYRKLRDFENALKSYQNSKIFGPSKSYFINWLKDNCHSQSLFKYQDKSKYIGTLSLKTSTFASKDKAKTLSKAKLAQSQDDGNNSNKDFFFLIMPYLVNYFQMKIVERKKWARDKIKDLARALKLEELLKSNVEKKILPHKEEFLKRFISTNEDKKKIPIAKSDLRLILRKFILFNLSNALKDTKNILKVVYLARIALMNNDIVDKRTNLNIIKKWKYYTTVQKISKQANEAIYKGMMAQYMNVVQTLNDENGVFNKMTDLTNTLGLFKNEPNDFENSIKIKFSKKIDKKYNFGPPEPQNEDLENNKDNYEILDPEGEDSFIMGREAK